MSGYIAEGADCTEEVVLTSDSLGERLGLVRLCLRDVNVVAPWASEATGITVSDWKWEVGVARKGDWPDWTTGLWHGEGAVFGGGGFEGLIVYLVVPVAEAGVVFAAVGEEGRGQGIGIVTALVVFDEVDTHCAAFLAKGMVLRSC